MTLRSSPTTSEIARQTVGPDAAAARRPPFTADKCLRIVFSAVMSAPALQQRVHRRPLVLERQRRRRARPSTPMRRPRAARRACRRDRSAARPRARGGPPRRCARPAADGSTESTRACAGSAIGRCVPMTMPSRMRSPAIAANVSAMNGAALPTAMTRRSLPRRRDAIAGSCTARSIRWCGDAASMAPRAMVRKCWRKCDRSEVSVNVLRIGPARQPRHHVELPQQAG